MVAPKDKLNPRQSKFVEEYLVDLNATQAAIRAGYSAKTARQIGSRLLTVVVISDAIAKRQEKVVAKTGLQRERILKEVELLAFSRVNDFLVNTANGSVTLADGVSEDAWASVSAISRTPGMFGVSVKLSFHDKPGMLKLAGRHRAIEGFSERAEAPADVKPTDLRVFTGLPPDEDDDLPAGAATA